MTNKDLADLIFPNINKTIEDYEKMYPSRNGQVVTRFAPSPTGYVHIGGIFQAIIDVLLAKNNNGVFYLRIEDTDQKREMSEAVNLIRDALYYYDLVPDEYELDGKTVGNYGPYVQSERKEIYHAFIKHLIEIGRAYPCFCTKETLEELRVMQDHKKQRTGYYGKYAKCRNITPEEAINRIKAGEPYVIRFKSMGDFERKFKFHDEVKGDLELSENDEDFVIMKSDNLLPTYHFAHLVDDHLMRTTHVVRGQEWMSSVPVHYELFKTFGFKMPKYIHTPLILKKDGDKIRKISKRLDPEARMTYYEEKGYPVYSLIEAIMTIANSNYEQWREGHPDADFTEFEFSPKKMSSAGALFDLDKLDNISKNYLSKLKASEVFDGLDEWSKIYDTDFNALINKYKDYTISVLNIEREQKKPRKDFACFSEVKDNIWYMYNELFDGAIFDFSFLKHEEDAKKIIFTYLNEYFDINDDKDTWFNKIKDLTEKMGYCSNMKEYKENPDNYRGSTADISNVIRVALTTKLTTPDLYEIINILGDAEVRARFSKICG